MHAIVKKTYKQQQNKTKQKKNKNIKRTIKVTGEGRVGEVAGLKADFGIKTSGYYRT